MYKRQYHEGTVAYSNLMEDSTLHGLSARRLVAKMRGPFGAAFPDPPPHYLPGNEDEDFVKVWTDGSVYFPQSNGLHLAGQGLHVGNMQSAQGLCIPQNLSLFVHASRSERSMELWSPMPGHMCSSTRVETAAALLAIGLPYRVDIRSDSAAMLATLRRVLVPNFRPKRPWGLMPNGDLWHVIHQHVLAKGSDHITCTKVKGHATDQDVSNGIATREDKLRNDTADKVADSVPDCLDAPSMSYISCQAICFPEPAP